MTEEELSKYCKEEHQPVWQVYDSPLLWCPICGRWR